MIKGAPSFLSRKSHHSRRPQSTIVPKVWLPSSWGLGFTEVAQGRSFPTSNRFFKLRRSFHKSFLSDQTMNPDLPSPPQCQVKSTTQQLAKKGKLRSITGCIVASTTSASMYTIHPSLKIPLKLLELLQQQPLSLEQMTQACLQIQSWHQQVSSTTWGPLSELQHMHKSHGPTA